ncbi:hypothetical protein [Oceanobacillus kapialis]|uniref:hypothetical protein n=1 Tax=Oceanobacillus kapialis TaxID=481353 RepID=UPI00384C9F8E
MKSLRTKAQGWVYFLYDHYFQEDANNNLTDFIQYFKVEGFANEPEVYIKTTNEGLEFGYIATRWDGYMVLLPSGQYKKHLLPWSSIKLMNKENQQERILELLMKTINSRKRQYRKCQFCGEKLATEHRIDDNTCHSCASKYLGVVF